MISEDNITFNKGKVTPWLEWDEWMYVMNGLYHCSLDNYGIVTKALDIVSVWKLRGKLPHAIEITANLVEIKLKTHINHLYPKCDLSRSENELRLNLSLTIIRAVNGFVDNAQNKMFAESVYGLAEKIGIPGWIVQLRHEATHNEYPSLSTLQQASQFFISYLYSNYWLLQYNHLQSLSYAFIPSSNPSLISNYYAQQLTSKKNNIFQLNSKNIQRNKITALHNLILHSHVSILNDIFIPLFLDATLLNQMKLMDESDSQSKEIITIISLDHMTSIPNEVTIEKILPNFFDQFQFYQNEKNFLSLHLLLSCYLKELSRQYSLWSLQLNEIYIVYEPIYINMITRLVSTLKMIITKHINTVDIIQLTLPIDCSAMTDKYYATSDNLLWIIFSIIFWMENFHSIKTSVGSEPTEVSDADIKSVSQSLYKSQSSSVTHLVSNILIAFQCLRSVSESMEEILVTIRQLSTDSTANCLSTLTMVSILIELLKGMITDIDSSLNESSCCLEQTQTDTALAASMTSFHSDCDKSIHEKYDDNDCGESLVKKKNKLKPNFLKKIKNVKRMKFTKENVFPFKEVDLSRGNSNGTIQSFESTSPMTSAANATVSFLPWQASSHQYIWPLGYNIGECSSVPLYLVEEVDEERKEADLL